jgi:primosomal protein N' (replication factor Y)
MRCSAPCSTAATTAFAAEALAERRAAGFPPFSHLCLLRAEATQQADLDAFLQAAFVLAGNTPGVERHPPMPAPMPRRAGRMRAQMLLSSPQRVALQALLRDLFPQLHALREAKKVRWSLDVDPVDMY